MSLSSVRTTDNGSTDESSLLLVITCLMMIANMRFITGSIELSPNVTLSSGVCPQVTFNCTAVDLPSTTLRWFIDDDTIASYPFVPTHQFPYNETITSSPWTDVVMIQIVEASYSDSSFDRANFYSTLTANLSALVMLGGNSISCGSPGTRSTTGIDFQYIAPPTRPLLECSLIISPRDVSLSSSFSSGNNVTNYHVVASPTTSSCLSDQLVRPSEDCSCSGLVLGTRYSFNVSAINCGNQEGAENTIIVHPQVPLIPEIESFLTYYNENSLSQLTMTWQVMHLSISDVCSVDNSLYYTIFLNDSRGGRLEERVVNSDSCYNNLCFTIFTLSSSPSQNYLVSIYAVNAFGQSIGNLLQSEALSHILTFEDCVTTLLCSSVLAEGPCIVQYGRDSSYENFDNHLNVSLNSPSPLPLMDASTQYYFQVEVRVNSTSYRSRRSFMTGEFAIFLTASNLGLLTVGILLLLAGFLITVHTSKCFKRKSTKFIWITPRITFIISAIILASVCLWITVNAYVGPQKNTCDPAWQSTRDCLIVSAFVLSVISFLITAVFTFPYLRGTRGEELAAAHGVNTSQSPNIEMKANQVYGVSDGHGEIVMEKNIVYGLTKHPE